MMDHFTETQRRVNPLVLHWHLGHFVDYRLLHKTNPVYLALVQDPVDNFINSFYHKRALYLRSKVLYQKTRCIGQHMVPDFETWVKKDVEECILDETDEECNFARESSMPYSLVVS